MRPTYGSKTISSHAASIARARVLRCIAHLWARDSHGKDHLFDGELSVNLVSMYSSKCLEFERVFIPAIDTMPGKGQDEVGKAKLLYVAMTPATERLVMSCVGEAGLRVAWRRW